MSLWNVVSLREYKLNVSEYDVLRIIFRRKKGEAITF
jgi:hypothetical protein